MAKAARSCRAGEVGITAHLVSPLVGFAGLRLLVLHPLSCHLLDRFGRDAAALELAVAANAALRHSYLRRISWTSSLLTAA